MSATKNLPHTALDGQYPIKQNRIRAVAQDMSEAGLLEWAPQGKGGEQ